jgi:hypothetical protein
VRFVLAILAFVAASGCDWRADGGQRLQGLIPEVLEAACAATDAAALEVGEVTGDSLAGTWALLKVGHASIAKPVAMDLTITDLFLVQVPPDRSVMTWTFCDQAVTSTSALFGGTTTPGALQADLALVPLVFPLDGTDTLPGGHGVWSWGVQGLPEGEPLPEAADDPRLWDQDGDGLPAVTVEVTTPKGHRYMARRERFDLKPATLDPGGQGLEGQFDLLAVDEHVYDADHPLLKTVAAMTPAALGNTFTLRRVPAEFGCTEVRAARDALFPPAPEVAGE